MYIEKHRKPTPFGIYGSLSSVRRRGGREVPPVKADRTLCRNFFSLVSDLTRVLGCRQKEVGKDYVVKDCDGDSAGLRGFRGTAEDAVIPVEVLRGKW